MTTLQRAAHIGRVHLARKDQAAFKDRLATDDSGRENGGHC